MSQSMIELESSPRYHNLLILAFKFDRDILLRLQKKELIKSRKRRKPIYLLLKSLSIR